VVKFNGSTGAFIGVFIAPGVGAASGGVFGSDGDLYEAGGASAGVRRYNGSTGAFISQFIPSNGVRADGGGAFGPDGNWYVGYYNNGNPVDFIARYNGQTGSFIDTFVPPGVIGEIAGFVFSGTGPNCLASSRLVSGCITVFPSQSANSGPINVLFTGSPLLHGAQVRLGDAYAAYPGGVEPINDKSVPGTNTSSPSSSSLSAAFDLTGATPNSRDVIITPEVGSPIVLPGAFTILQAPSSCSYTVAPLNPSFPASGGGGSVVVTSNVNTAQCNFHTFDSFPSNVAWITPSPISHIAVGGLGFAGEAISYTVAANPSASARSTTVSIFGQSVTVSQGGIGACSYNLSPASEIFAASGGSFKVTVLSAGGCGWSASSTLNWLHVTAGTSGSGTGVVTIQADPNSGGLRSGSITIAGKPFNVSQSADACGATDVSSQVSVSAGTILADFSGTSYPDPVTLHNQGTTNVAGPIYLVLDGLPSTRASCGNFLGETQTCSVRNTSRLTYCQSPSGSDMVLVAPNGLAPGQQASDTLIFVPGPGGGAAPPNWVKFRVFSGTPSQ
jgi:hypothetical protein